MSDVIMIKNWSFNVDPDPYRPPEQKGLHLVGEVAAHPNWPTATEPMRIRTSRVVAIDRDLYRVTVKTQTGRLYMLMGPPEEGYARYCMENDINILTPLHREKEVPS